MINIKENIINVKTSSTLAINELSKKLEKKGKKIYKFGLGQSPFPVPENIVKELQNIYPLKDKQGFGAEEEERGSRGTHAA